MKPQANSWHDGNVSLVSQAMLRTTTITNVITAGAIVLALLAVVWWRGRPLASIVPIAFLFGWTQIGGL